MLHGDTCANAHHFEAFLGLVPSEHSSGEKRRLGSITKAGNLRVRYLQVEAAWRILSRKLESAALRDWAQRIAERRGRRIAVVALARRLAGVLYALWRDGRPFNVANCASSDRAGSRRNTGAGRASLELTVGRGHERVAAYGRSREPKVS
ncbi:MAG: transposase [Longimicrobiales bacterium]